MRVKALGLIKTAHAVAADSWCVKVLIRHLDWEGNVVALEGRWLLWWKQWSKLHCPRRGGVSSAVQKWLRLCSLRRQRLLMSGMLLLLVLWLECGSICAETRRNDWFVEIKPREGVLLRELNCRWLSKWSCSERIVVVLS